MPKNADVGWGNDVGNIANIDERKVSMDGNLTGGAGSAASDRPFIVSVEGNIGSGKSTMLSYFEKFGDVELVPEPVGQWCDLNGHNLLAKLYEDPSRWSFQFQSYVQLTRLQLLKSPTTFKVKIVERSIQNNRFCFLELARKYGTMTEAEHVVLSQWYEFLERNMTLDLDLIVYLRSSPAVAFDRMKKRNRCEESGAPLLYLERLHGAYEEWLVKQRHGKIEVPILILDADKTKEEMVQTYLQFKDVIRGSQKVSGVIYQDGISTNSDVASDCEKANVSQVLSTVARNEVQR